MFVTTSVQLSVAVAVPLAAAVVLASQLIVTSTGHVIAGLVVSCTNMVCLQLFELPQLSTAVQSLASV
jgi:hypothetical protein